MNDFQPKMQTSKTQVRQQDLSLIEIFKRVTRLQEPCGEDEDEAEARIVSDCPMRSAPLADNLQNGADILCRWESVAAFGVSLRSIGSKK